MIDSHCHLADKKFAHDLDDVLLRAEEHGVTAMVTIADTLKESKRCIELAERHDQIFCTAGVHPHAAKEWQNSDLDTLRAMLISSDKVKALGEIGLDYHYNFSPPEIQRSVFRVQLELAKELAVPVVIHCREAIGDICSILDEIRSAKAVLHCCTERWEDAEPLVSQGFLLGFTGIATYPQSGHIREVIRNCPLDQMMIETDSPYLAPQAMRGKRNEPAFVVEVAKLVAELKGLPLQEVDRATTENTVAFYGLPS